MRLLGTPGSSAAHKPTASRATKPSTIQDGYRITLWDDWGKALDAIAEMRALFDGIVGLYADSVKPSELKQIETTLGHVRDMTRIAETEMRALMFACTRARRQMLETLPVAKPTQH